ncbi:hypothetical protein NBRC116597_05070 [Phaeobacter sp. NW0010-22]
MACHDLLAVNFGNYVFNTSSQAGFGYDELLNVENTLLALFEIINGRKF